MTRAFVTAVAGGADLARADGVAVQRFEAAAQQREAGVRIADRQGWRPRPRRRT